MVNFVDDIHHKFARSTTRSIDLLLVRTTMIHHVELHIHMFDVFSSFFILFHHEAALLDGSTIEMYTKIII